MNCTPVEKLPWDPYELTSMVHRSLHLLDRMERDSTGDRLTAVADLVMRSAGIPGWSAFNDRAGDSPRLVLRHLMRPVLVPDGVFELPLGPVVEGFGIHANATSGSHALQRRRERTGIREILVVGGYAPDAARWVVEFYADDAAPDLVPMLPALYAVVQAALSFPEPARPRRERDPRSNGLAMSLLDGKTHRSRDAK